MNFWTIREGIDGLDADAKTPDRGQFLATFSDATNAADISLVEGLAAMDDTERIRGEIELDRPRALPALASRKGVLSVLEELEDAECGAVAASFRPAGRQGADRLHERLAAGLPRASDCLALHASVYALDLVSPPRWFMQATSASAPPKLPAFVANGTPASAPPSIWPQGMAGRTSPRNQRTSTPSAA